MTASQTIEDPSASRSGGEVFKREELEKSKTLSSGRDEPYPVADKRAPVAIGNGLDDEDVQARTELQEGNVYFIWWVIILSVVAVGYFTSFWV
ncbi:hypothetical protein AAIB41_12325 [Brucella sp. BE17]|uniref:hypothetical protein n=1 Tax=Brucella sp. BE17 TaxID=3142977 RepID=UPI0031BB9108